MRNNIQIFVLLHTGGKGIQVEEVFYFVGCAAFVPSLLRALPLTARAVRTCLRVPLIASGMWRPRRIAKSPS